MKAAKSESRSCKPRIPLEESEVPQDGTNGEGPLWNAMLAALTAPSSQLLSKLKEAPGTSGCEDPAGVVAAEIRSLGGEGALEWHLQTPFKPSLTVDAKTYSVLVHLELSLLTGRTSTRGPATHARL